MNKAELAAEIAKNTGLTKVDSEKATEALLNTVAATLKKKAAKFAWSALARSALPSVLRPKVAIRARVRKSGFRLPNSRNSKRENF